MKSIIVWHWPGDGILDTLTDPTTRFSDDWFNGLQWRIHLYCDHCVTKPRWYRPTFIVLIFHIVMMSIRWPIHWLAFLKPFVVVTFQTWRYLTVTTSLTDRPEIHCIVDCDRWPVFIERYYDGIDGQNCGLGEHSGRYYSIVLMLVVEKSIPVGCNIRLVTYSTTWRYPWPVAGPAMTDPLFVRRKSSLSHPYYGVVVACYWRYGTWHISNDQYGIWLIRGDDVLLYLLSMWLTLFIPNDIIVVTGDDSLKADICVMLIPLWWHCVYWPLCQFSKRKPVMMTHSYIEALLWHWQQTVFVGSSDSKEALCATPLWYLLLTLWR